MVDIPGRDPLLLQWDRMTKAATTWILLMSQGVNDIQAAEDFDKQTDRLRQTRGWLGQIRTKEKK